MKKPPSKLMPVPGPTPPPRNRGWPEGKEQARHIGLPARKRGESRIQGWVPYAYHLPRASKDI